MNLQTPHRTTACQHTSCGFRARLSVGLSCRIIGVCLALFFASGSLRAEDIKGAIRRRQRAALLGEFTGPRSMVIESAAPIMNLFSRAEEGIARGDWKFAIDSLQRIVDDEEGSLVSRSMGGDADVAIYESARRKAIHRIATFPKPGLDAYRVLYDGRARRLIEQAKATHNIALLQEVVDRFLPTRYGDDATELLASWLLDEGRAAEALSILLDHITLIGKHDVSDDLVFSKLAVAYYLLGRGDDAKGVLSTYAQMRPVSASPPDWFSDLSSVINVSPLLDGRVTDGDTWPVWGGSGARRNVMTPVTPTLVDPLPWVYDFPAASDRVWRQACSENPDESCFLPADSPVGDGTLLFVRLPRGCSALDVEDLSVVWSTDAGAADTTSGLRAVRRASNGRSLGRFMEDPTFPDYVRSGLGLAYGLVLAVERTGTGALVTDEGETVVPAPAAVGRRVVRRSDIATRLVARDAETGTIVWHRGRTFDARDPLGDVEFRSVPIAVGERLWVPFRRNRDLAIAVLDPKDGRMESSFVLGVMEQASKGDLHALTPAFSDGVVFVPSGFGVLFAVDAERKSVRWAVNYGSDTKRRRQVEDADGQRWYSSPPMVSGGRVYLASPENHKLFAFDAISGTLLWSVVPDDALYLFGADSGQVYVGGRTISCLSAMRGTTKWTALLDGVPTGRAAVSGDLVYAPTTRGLVILNAQTGETVETLGIPPSQRPLGNLLCYKGSMFSTDGTSVRKFPDLDRAYARTKETYEDGPTNPLVSVRLAWLELFRHNPRRTYELLKQLPKSAFAADSRGENSAAHLRVAALLAMADEKEATPDQALEYVRLAERAASSVPDRLKSGMAIASRLAYLGQPLEAYRKLFEIGLSPQADVAIPLVDHVRTHARLGFSRRLADLEADLETDLDRAQLALFHKELLVRVEKLGQSLRDNPSSPRKQLRAVADLMPHTPIGQRALLELASYERERFQFERAEQLFRECYGLGTDQGMTALALVELCRLYTDGDQRIQPAVAPLIRLLQERYADTMLPNAPSWWAQSGDDTATGQSVRAWFTRFTARFPDIGTDRAMQFDPVDPFTITHHMSWSPWKVTQGRDRPRVLDFDGVIPAPLSGQMIVVGSDDVFASVDLRSGDTLWRAELRFPELTESSGNNLSRNVNAVTPRRAVVDGQTALINASDGLFAVGLVTGRRLWARPYSAGIASLPAAHRDYAMAARDGVVAVVPDGGHLVLLRVADGQTLWDRDINGGVVAYVWMLDGRVITADRRLQRMHIFDQSDGRLIKQVTWRQPGTGEDTVHTVFTKGVMCGPDWDRLGDGVAGVDLHTGEKLWRVHVNKPLKQIFAPGDGLIGIGTLGGDLLIVDARTGDLVLERSIEGAQAVTDATLVDGTLVVRISVGGRRNRPPQLAGVDIATGEALWTRTDIVDIGRLGEPLRVIGGLVPATIRIDPSGKHNRRPHLTMIDIRTGRNAGTPVELFSGDKRAVPNGDFGIWPGAIVVGTTSGISVFATKPWILPKGEGF